MILAEIITWPEVAKFSVLCIAVVWIVWLVCRSE